MYKYKSGQISITDFGQPMGMHLNENNRWVKKAAMIPWRYLTWLIKNPDTVKDVEEILPRNAPDACKIQ